jgi:glycosyltransferase involved in cell wall biosynthesis
LRIAIVTRNARVVGGVESYLDAIIPMLEAAGREVALFCEYDSPLTSQPISRTANAPTWCLNGMGTRRLFESLREWQPDLIYSHGLTDTETEARLLTLAPSIVFAHDYRATCISGSKSFAFLSPKPCSRILSAGCLGNFYPRRCGGLNPFTMVSDFRHAFRRLALLRSARAVLTASNFMRNEYVRHGLAPAAVRCVGLPVIDRGSRRTPSITSAISSSTEPLRLLYAGRMESIKGGGALIDALPLLSAALSRPILLTLAGDGGSRIEWARRVKTIVHSHPTIRVEFTGWIDSAALTSLFDSSDLLVVPSLWPEPFGLVGPEAGARGLPAVAFDLGGIPEWLTDGVNGALARGLPPFGARLADAIVQCLRDPDTHARMRRGATELARRFSPERHLDALTTVIEEFAMSTPAIRPHDSGRPMSASSHSS